MKRYDIGADKNGWPTMRNFESGKYYLVSDVEQYTDGLIVFIKQVLSEYNATPDEWDHLAALLNHVPTVTRTMIPRPDAEEARSLSEIVEYLDRLIKGEEYHQNICDECYTSAQRSRDRVYKYKAWKAAVLALMGVEG